MTAYDFRPEFEKPIVSGAKTFTLRAPSGKKPPALGRPVQIYVGLRAPGARLLAERPCVLRARLTLTPTGVLRVLNLQAAPSAQGLANLIEGCQQGDARAPAALPRLAALDGFADFAAFYAFHLKTEQDHKRRTPRGRIVRELIGWEPVR